MQYIDGKVFRDMIIGAANELERNKKYIDSLNVFPVPDGDTGTNMSLSLMTAAKEVEKLDTDNISIVADTLASGLLRGARGNSGVITSQLARGLSKALKSKEKASAIDLANGIKLGAEIAYKAVMKPKEGTILTVARETGEYAVKSVAKVSDIEEHLKLCVEHANKVLDRTPDMLPVLKQAGVVDSGGKGLVVMLEGALNILLSGERNISISASTQKNEVSVNVGVDNVNIDTANIKFAYCTEFLIKGSNFSDKEVNSLKSKFETIGDCVLVIGDDDVIKVHVHTNEPGTALNEAIKIGTLNKIKIENMKEQHSGIVFDKNETDKLTNEKEEVVETEKKEIGFIAVSVGEGMSSIFKDLGVDHIISGGQTMNPSTEDILKAIDKVNADTIYIFPNNSNIILAANQAKSISEKHIEVVPTKNVAQCISAMIAFDLNSNIEDNMKNMQEAYEAVKVGQVTFAARDTVFEDKEIKSGDMMGIVGSKIEVVEKDLEETVKKVIDKLIDEESAVISIYYGEDVEEKDAERIREYVEENYKDLDVDIYFGGQPLYYYIISVE